jgi:hypothetical protein
MKDLKQIDNMRYFIFKNLEGDSFQVKGFDNSGILRFDQIYIINSEEHKKFAKIFGDKCRREGYSELWQDFETWSVDFSHGL